MAHAWRAAQRRQCGPGNVASGAARTRGAAPVDARAPRGSDCEAQAFFVERRGGGVLGIDGAGGARKRRRVLAAERERELRRLAASFNMFINQDFNFFLGIFYC